MDNFGGIEQITSIDAGRLRISFAKTKPTPPKIKEEPSRKEVVLEVQANPRPAEGEGLQGWAIGLGYAAFGVALALNNLFAVPFERQVCAFMCPIPMLCLVAQGSSVMPEGFILGSLVALAAWPMPLVCFHWSILWGALWIVFLSALQAAVFRHWSGVICLFLISASLLLAVIPVKGVEPKWGVTVAIFLLITLCILASQGGRGVLFRIKYL